MPIEIVTSSIQRATSLAAGCDEALSVMPRSESSGSGWLAWPAFAIPNTMIEVSDLGYGGLHTEDDLAEVLAHHPELIPPTKAHADAIVAFGRRVVSVAASRPYRVLVHCHGGISRSPAAALAIFAIEDGHGNEATSFERLRSITNHGAPTPNWNLVKLVDETLGRDGRLYQTILDAERPISGAVA